MFVSEGLHENDLDGVIIPVISIDEYLGKIEDDSVVISFFLSDPDAALDLSSFIESGPFEILDTDVSKAINEDGYYQVFVEMERSKYFYNNLMDIVDNLKSLTEVSKWSFMSPRTKGEAVSISQSNIDECLFTAPKTKKDPRAHTMEEELMDYLSLSDATNVRIADNNIIFENTNLNTVNHFVTFSDSSLVHHILGISNKTPTQSQSIVENINTISSILGPDWLVESAGQFILITSKFDASKTILLK